VTLSATLMDGSSAISGRSLRFALGSTTCTATTSSTGVGQCAVTAAAPLGSQLVTVSFAGDSTYQSASVSSHAFVYDAPAGGMFAVGDKSATGRVTFWGSQWASQNKLSGGSAPTAFKGFGSRVSQPACGAQWTTSPGNSPGPPGSVPAFMSVIV